MILSFNTYTSEPTQRSRENGAIVVRPSEPFSAKCGHVMQLRPYQQDALERTLKCHRQSIGPQNRDGELKRDYATDRRGLNIDGTVDRDSGPPPSMITLHQIWD